MALCVVAAGILTWNGSIVPSTPSTSQQTLIEKRQRLGQLQAKKLEIAAKLAAASPVPTKVSKPKKVVHVKRQTTKKTRNKKRTTAKRAASPAKQAWLEVTFLNWDRPSYGGALDVPEPLMVLASNELALDSVSEPMGLNMPLAHVVEAVNVRKIKSEIISPQKQSIETIQVALVPQYQPLQFTELSKTLNDHKTFLNTLQKVKAVPANAHALPVTTQSTKTKKQTTPSKAVANLVSPSLSSLASAAAPSIPSVPTPLVAPTLVLPSISSPKAKVAPDVATPTEPAKALAQKSVPTTSEPFVYSSTKKVSQGGVVYGDIIIDPSFASWLSARRGHIELILRRAGLANPSDTIFIDYSYPQDRFSFDMKDKEGEYELVAKVFAKGEDFPLSEIVHNKIISPENYKEKVIFEINRRGFMSHRMDRGKPHLSVLAATVFEGGTGNHQKAQPIAYATVEILGFDVKAKIKADDRGNIRIPGLPSLSHVRVRANAEGFYPTELTIPTRRGVVYQPIYLISQAKVDSTTRYFTKDLQDEAKAVVMGQAFSSQSRNPEAYRRISMSFQSSGPVYYQWALPDTNLRETTSSGLFGYFNVAPSFRVLKKDDKVQPHLLNVRGGHAYFIELGRAGNKTLKVKFVDPFRGHAPVAETKLVGAEQSEPVDNNGLASIKNIQTGPGILTTETIADGYPVTWHTVAWSPLTTKKTLELYMMDEETVETLLSIARIGQQKNLGILIGGADREFLSDKSCISVDLLDLNYQPVDAAKGPYSLTESPNDREKICLSPSAPGFAYYNLTSGEYLMRWKNSKGKVFRTRVVRVGSNRVSIAVN